MRRSNRYHIGNGRRSPSYSVIASFTNRDLGLLQLIQERVGGRIYPKSRKSLKHSPAYELVLLRKEDVCRFISNVGPFVVSKQPQLSLASQFLSLPRMRMDCVARGKTWPIMQANEEDLQLREAIKLSLTNINKRGWECLQ